MGMSTLGSGMIIAENAPTELLGFWNGRNDALTNIASGVAPLIFANVYDAVGNARGQEMLACTSVISFLATLAYVPLIKMLPKPPKKEKDEDAKDLSKYEQ